MRTRKVNPVNHENINLDLFDPEQAEVTALGAPVHDEWRPDQDTAKRGQPRQTMRRVSVSPACVATGAPGKGLEQVKVASPVKGRYFPTAFAFR